VRRIAIFPEVDTELAGRSPVVFSKNGYSIELIDCLSLKGAIGWCSREIIENVDGVALGDLGQAPRPRGAARLFPLPLEVAPGTHR
jgi:hypothetical protein